MNPLLYTGNCSKGISSSALNIYSVWTLRSAPILKYLELCLERCAHVLLVLRKYGLSRGLRCFLIYKLDHERVPELMSQAWYTRAERTNYPEWWPSDLRQFKVEPLKVRLNEVQFHQAPGIQTAAIVICPGIHLHCLISVSPKFYLGRLNNFIYWGSCRDIWRNSIGTDIVCRSTIDYAARSFRMILMGQWAPGMELSRIVRSMIESMSYCFFVKVYSVYEC